VAGARARAPFAFFRSAAEASNRVCSSRRSPTPHHRESRDDGIRREGTSRMELITRAGYRSLKRYRGLVAGNRSSIPRGSEVEGRSLDNREDPEI